MSSRTKVVAKMDSRTKVKKGWGKYAAEQKCRRDFLDEYKVSVQEATTEDQLSKIYENSKNSKHFFLDHLYFDNLRRAKLKEMWKRPQQHILA